MLPVFRPGEQLGVAAPQRIENHGGCSDGCKLAISRANQWSGAPPVTMTTT
jgi:hypothetical protein